ncbi:MAG: helix-turn-helix transcriptional regulator [Sulfurimonas sp.]|nr:helix-turn-helix transcriptional regulator [Sulfurimonas sp.]MDD3060190.1 helix-turn-helix transcriptional regulator [Sulfurimonas sp.]MDD5203218.1 helix-turn-helix transcriptional regulator [Sulfurimonas sp.]
MLSDYQVALLKKTISLQTKIIEGHSLQAVLRSETATFNAESGAATVALCIKNSGYVNIELVMEQDRKFLTLLRHFNVSAKHMFLNRFMQFARHNFQGDREYIKINSLHDIFDGAFSKAHALELEKEIDFREAYIFPFRSGHGKKIGFMLYIFRQENEIILEKLSELTKVVEVLVRPFYDDDSSTVHGKCVQVDNKMEILTEKERQIVQRVLHGKTHQDVADELNISINTLKTHMKNIFSKYGVSSKMELQNKIVGGF